MLSPMRTDWFFTSEDVTSDADCKQWGPGDSAMISSVNNVDMLSHCHPPFICSKHKRCETSAASARRSEGNRDAHEASLRHTNYWQPASWAGGQLPLINF